MARGLVRAGSIVSPLVPGPELRLEPGYAALVADISHAMGKSLEEQGLPPA